MHDRVIRVLTTVIVIAILRAKTNFARRKYQKTRKISLFSLNRLVDRGYRSAVSRNDDANKNTDKSVTEKHVRAIQKCTQQENNLYRKF